MATVWEEFGVAVAKARAAKKWTLAAVAELAFNSSDRKGYVSQIEKGRTKLHFSTVKKLADALDLPNTVTDPAFRADLPADDDVTAKDRNAERLIALTARDPVAPPAEALLIALAYEFAPGTTTDLITARNGLRAALEAAAELKARGSLPQNTDDQLQSIMQAVSRLNDNDQRDEAAATLEAEAKRIEAEADRLDATREAVFQLQLTQDRIRNRPEDAAARLIANLHRLAPPGGVFSATRALISNWNEKGDTQGLPFDLDVALRLAMNNFSRAKGTGQREALFDVALCQLRLGERTPDDRYLHAAVQKLRRCLKLFQRRTDPHDWAITQTNLGIALRILGDRSQDHKLLQQAITAHQAALTARTKESAPMEWGGTQMNLGNALQSLGKRFQDQALLRQAITAHQAALTVFTVGAAPLDWAKTQMSLGVALMALGEITQDPAPLQLAITVYQAALTVYTQYSTPMDWAKTQNNLGLAQRWLGVVQHKTTAFQHAQTAYCLCLQEWNPDAAPFLWAQTQWNLADLALARFDVAPDSALLETARAHTLAARAVFAQGSDYQTARCDDLLAKIAALEA